MNAARILLLLLALQGCAVLDVAEKPHTFAACGAADILTTAYAVHTGIAREANPLLAPSVNAHHFLPMTISKLAIVGVIWWIYDNYKEHQAARAGIAVASAATCSIAAHNLYLIVK